MDAMAFPSDAVLFSLLGRYTLCF